MNNFSKADILVSVIVPVYNLEKYILRCVTSISNQSYKNIEIILVDDGSVDRSSSICKETAKVDNRIIYIIKENGGVTSARKMGVSNAKGEYLMFVDGDDEIELNCIEKLLSVINETNRSDIVLGNLKAIPDRFQLNVPFEGIIDSKEYIELLLKGKVIWGPVCKLFKRKLFENKDCFAPEYIAKGEDAIMNVRIALHARSIHLVNDTVYYYYLHEESTTSTSKNRFCTSKEFLEQITSSLKDQSDNMDLSDSINVLKLNWWVDQVYNCECLPLPNKYIRKLLKEITRVGDWREFKGKHLKMYNLTKTNLLLGMLYSYGLHFLCIMSRYKYRAMNKLSKK
ncbi:glycosyltransferase family 2 protein [Carboxylicivirga marina]|uniref:glycosyltransferase family 2 protein n=1 Tax=Carboxylicivirga marina TaxID=2800988 RepID=UPI002594E3A7|nr:glycosyltransferase family 2 protein [uncultured Carboxylicivirga sp.]